MSGDVLSQAEVESLLSAMDQPRSRRRRRRGHEPHPRSREKITPYDFKRPERVGKEQMRALQTLHEGFGRNFGAALSALLAHDRRSEAHQRRSAHLQRVRVQPRKSRPASTCSRRSRSKGNLILDINPSILFPIIDRLLGGGNEAGATGPPAAHRDRAAACLADHRACFCDELKHAWENVLDAGRSRSTASKAIRNSCRSCRRTKSWC